MNWNREKLNMHEIMNMNETNSLLRISLFAVVISYTRWHRTFLESAYQSFSLHQCFCLQQTDNQLALECFYKYCYSNMTQMNAPLDLNNI